MIDQMIDDKKTLELKMYNHYLDKRTDIMKNTQFKKEDVFGDLVGKDSISTEQLTKRNKSFKPKWFEFKYKHKFQFIQT